jgi:hypothetical protein
MIFALAKNEIGALAGGKHILSQVHEINGFPNTGRCFPRFRIAQRGILMEVRAGVAESSRSQ